MQSSVEDAAPNVFPTLIYLYCYDLSLFFSFSTRLYNVFFSNTQYMNLWAFQVLKTTSQSVTPWEISPGWSKWDTRDKFPLWSGAWVCLSLQHTDCVCVCVCVYTHVHVFSSYSPHYMPFCSIYTEGSNFKVNLIVPTWIWIKDKASISENSRPLDKNSQDTQNT